MMTTKQLRALSARRIASLCDGLRAARMIMANEEWVTDGAFAIRHKELHDKVVGFLPEDKSITDVTRRAVENSIGYLVSCGEVMPCEPPQTDIARTVAKYHPKATCHYKASNDWHGGVYYWFIDKQCVAVCMERGWWNCEESE